MTPLPHTAMQLLSFDALHPDGQQLSLLAQPVIMPPSGALTHWTWHPVPVSTRRTQPMFGHIVGQAPAPPSPIPVSQSSPGSTTPFPQAAGQSPSRFALQPVIGQQPSCAEAPPIPHVRVPVATHCLVQAVPCSVYTVQPTFEHDDGQLPSQFSPDSTTLLPQKGKQLLSFCELHVPAPPPGQQLSPFTQAITVPFAWQAAEQVPPFTSV
jgi:hypothetical protein